MTTIKTEYEYINFKQQLREGRLSSVWMCVNNRGRYSIGRVQWHGSWRQYCFFPSQDTVYSAGCLRDIQEFIAALMEERRAGA